jgi:hypothetical protein
MGSDQGTAGITPDTKDWTWILERPCPQCGLDVRSMADAAIAVRIRDNAGRWPRVLARPDVRQRANPAVWSALEYGCHVRDVFRLYHQRLMLMLTREDPTYPDWDQDATAVQDRYCEQDPAIVTSELVEAAEVLADRFAVLRPDQWQRPGRRGDGARFTVSTFARYLLHDPVHHLHDVAG